MCVGRWRLAPGQDYVGARCQFGNEPHTLRQYDEYEHAAPGPELTAAPGGTNDDEQQYECYKLSLVEGSKHHSPDVKCDGSRD